MIFDGETFRNKNALRDRFGWWTVFGDQLVVPRHTDCNLLSFSLPHFTFSRISLVNVVQIKGAGALL